MAIVAGIPEAIDYFCVTWINNDYAEVTAVQVGVGDLGRWEVTYDTLGRAGMSEMLDVFTDVARIIGAQVQVEGTPGV